MIFAVYSAGECPACPEAVWKRNEFRCDEAVFEAWCASWSLPFHCRAWNIRLHSYKPLWRVRAIPPSHTRGCTHAPTLAWMGAWPLAPCPLWGPVLSKLDPPIFIHSCSSSLLISSTDANEAETAVLGMDKIPHWLQNASSQRWEYWIPRHQNYPRIQYGRGKNTHSYSRHIGWEIPGKKKNLAIQMRCVYVCLAFEERRGVVSLKRRKGPLRCIPPPFSALSHPSLRLQLRATPTCQPPPRPTPHARTRTHIFTIACCLWGRHGG